MGLKIYECGIFSGFQLITSPALSQLPVLPRFHGGTGGSATSPRSGAGKNSPPALAGPAGRLGPPVHIFVRPGGQQKFPRLVPHCFIGGAVKGKILYREAPITAGGNITNKIGDRIGGGRHPSPTGNSFCPDKKVYRQSQHTWGCLLLFAGIPRVA